MQRGIIPQKSTKVSATERERVRFTGRFVTAQYKDSPWVHGEFEVRDGKTIRFELDLSKVGKAAGLDREGRYALAGQRGATIDGVWLYKGTGGELKSMPDPSAPVRFSAYYQRVPYIDIDRIIAEEAPK